MHNSDSHDKTTPGIPWKKVLLWGLLITIGIGVLVLVIKAARRGGAGAVLAAGIPVVAHAVKPQPKPQKPITKQPLPSKDFILARLKNIANAVMRDRSHYFITPAELYDVMPAVRIPFSSLLHMVQVLKSLGLKSEIRSVPGREERRWYDLSGFAGDRNDG